MQAGSRVSEFGDSLFLRLVDKRLLVNDSVIVVVESVDVFLTLFQLANLKRLL